MTDEFIICHLNIEYWFFLLLLSSFQRDKDYFLGYEVIHCHHQYPIRFTIIIDATVVLLFVWRYKAFYACV